MGNSSENWLLILLTNVEMNISLMVAQHSPSLKFSPSFPFSTLLTKHSLKVAFWCFVVLSFLEFMLFSFVVLMPLFLSWLCFMKFLLFLSFPNFILLYFFLFRLLSFCFQNINDVFNYCRLSKVDDFIYE